MIGHARSAVDHEKYRFRIILALDEHSLFEAIDIDPDLFRDAVAQWPPIAVKEEPGFASTQQPQCAEKSY
jgi:hypothetical protein